MGKLYVNTYVVQTPQFMIYDRLTGHRFGFGVQAKNKESIWKHTSSPGYRYRDPRCGLAAEF